MPASPADTGTASVAPRPSRLEMLCRSLKGGIIAHGSLPRSEAIMAIRTALTEVFGLEYPIVLAPMGPGSAMGGVGGGRLAAAVSNAGGLGLVGGGYGDPDWVRTQLALVQASTTRPWGVGLITWYINREVVGLALSYRPAAVLLSFGDIRPYASAIKAAGCTMLCQVQEV